MDVRDPHPWRVSYGEALALQEKLRRRLRFEPLLAPPRLVAGADVAYSRASHRMFAAVVVLEMGSLVTVEIAESVSLARFPYIPGLFSFRELPPLLRAFRKLSSWPDVLLFDGQGEAHPRRFGLACHAGVLLETPSVGCAKSRLVGDHGSVGERRGDRAALLLNGELVGFALRTRAKTKPVYVSCGHRVDLKTATNLVLATTRGFRLPEPLRLAHMATTALMRREEPALKPPKTRGYPDFVKAVRTSDGRPSG